MPHDVTGLNRTPGLVTNCGGFGLVYPVAGAQHDYTCGNEHEMVVFGSEFGAPLPEGAGVQVTLDAAGVVTAVAQIRGGSEPVGAQKVVQATGDEAVWLEANAELGQRLVLREKVVDTGTRLPLTADTSVVNGGPDLVDDGRVALEPVRDGWSPAPIAGTSRADFYWLVRPPQPAHRSGRSARRSAGLRAGRRPTARPQRRPEPTETARLLAALGAVGSARFWNR